MPLLKQTTEKSWHPSKLSAGGPRWKKGSQRQARFFFFPPPAFRCLGVATDHLLLENGPAGGFEVPGRECTRVTQVAAVPLELAEFPCEVWAVYFWRFYS